MDLFRTILEMIIYISTNFERKWVKIFKPHLQNTLKKLVYKIENTLQCFNNCMLINYLDFR